MDPLALSAELLRSAVALQGSGSKDMIHELTMRSGALKCVALGKLNPQDLWSFWVNVFHSLLVHAQLVVGRPRSLQRTVSFFNKCSYVVAGHAFSLVEIEHCILRRHMSKPRIRFAQSVLKIWPRTDHDLENKPCLAAPTSPAASFSCRADWRLNLILNAGNYGSPDVLPVFESADEATFNATMKRTIDQTLVCCGRIGEDIVELPYSLCRYKDDAPAGTGKESSELRWARLVAPTNAQAGVKIVYRRQYGWAMRQHLMVMQTE